MVYTMGGLIFIFMISDVPLCNYLRLGPRHFVFVLRNAPNCETTMMGTLFKLPPCKVRNRRLKPRKVRYRRLQLRIVINELL